MAKAGNDAVSGGDHLARLRKARGLTQVELAERLGTRQSLLSKYERGQLRLNVDLIVKLTQILHASADEILGIEPPPQIIGIQNRRLLRRLGQIGSLPKRDQDALLRTINKYLPG